MQSLWKTDFNMETLKKWGNCFSWTFLELIILKFLRPLEFLSGSPRAGEKDPCWFIRGNKRNQTFACFNYKLDAALSTGLESDAVRKVKGRLGNRYSVRRNWSCLWVVFCKCLFVHLHSRLSRWHLTFEKGPFVSSLQNKDVLVRCNRRGQWLLLVIQ